MSSNLEKQIKLTGHGLVLPRPERPGSCSQEGTRVSQRVLGTGRARKSSLYQGSEYHHQAHENTLPSAC